MIILEKILDKFSLKLSDVKEEYGKLGITRIFIGIIILFRVIQLTNESRFYFETSGQFYYGLIFSVLALLFTIGFFTPLITILLILFWHWIDAVMQCYTLGSSILILYLYLFTITNFGGAKYSLDNYFINKKNNVSKFLIKFYNISGNLSLKQLKITYLIILTAYALISFSAAIYHLHDPSWLNGTTTIELLTNSYLSKFHHFFRSIHLQYPLLFLFFSEFSMIGQTIFQILMIPLLFNKYGIKFIKIWGLGFFLISLFFIQLGYLPHIEIILWFIIFYRKKDKESVVILYDDFCNLCKNSMKFLKFLNFNNAYQFLPLSKNLKYVEVYNIDRIDVKETMHGFFKNNLYTGYKLYVKLFWVNPFLITFWPIMKLGELTHFGPYIYKHIAKRRLKYFGTCELSFDINTKKNDDNSINEFNKNIFKFYCFSYIFICIIFIFFKFPIISYYSKKIIEPLEIVTGFNVSEGISNFIYCYTPFVIPDVFNKTDLSMDGNWAVIYRLVNNKRELVPITSIDGSRLNYNNFDWLLFGNHNCDFLYFGNTLGYRRGIIGQNVINFNQKNKTGYNNIIKRIRYDYRKRNQNDKINYLCEIYESKNSNNLKKPSYKNKKVLSFKISYDEFKKN